MDLQKLEDRLSMYDQIIELSRQIRIKCSKAIAMFHVGKEEELPENEVKELLEILNNDPLMWGHAFGSATIALQEFVEAKALRSLIKEGKLPEIEEIPEHAYLLGLADVVGELKRYFLEKIISGDKKEAKRILDLALWLFDYLSQMHYPDAIAPGFRRKKDVARGVVNSMLMVYAEKASD